MKPDGNSKRERLVRCQMANDLIEMIGSSGKKYFCTKKTGEVSYFLIQKNRVYYVDMFTGKKIFAYHNSSKFDRYFAGGGTLRALVLDLAEYIRTGLATNGNNGFGGVCSEDWKTGYSEDEMAMIRAKASEIGFL